MKENLQELIRLVQENPELPVICEVDGEICCGDEYAWYLGEFGRCFVGEYAVYNDRVFVDDREGLKEEYYGRYDEELCEKFGYDPRINEWTTNKGQYTPEQFTANSEREEALDAYLDKIADRYFKRAIIVNIIMPDYELEPEEKE